MKVIKADLPSDIKLLELHVFADEHIGDEQCDLKRLRERIEYVKNTPNAYCVLNGDIIDNATKTSIGDVYANSFQPMEQLKVAMSFFLPLKDKILAITHGNHENRTYRKEGINLSYLMACQLGLEDKYTPTSALMFLRFGENSRGFRESNGSGNLRKMCYTIYMLHGSGGGRKEGAKAIRLADMANIVNAQVFLHAHTHAPMIMRNTFFEIDKQNSSVHTVDRLFVNTAANLDYGGYSEAGEYKPCSKETPVIYFDGTQSKYWANL